MEIIYLRREWHRTIFSEGRSPRGKNSNLCQSLRRWIIFTILSNSMLGIFVLYPFCKTITNKYYLENSKTFSNTMWLYVAFFFLCLDIGSSQVNAQHTAHCIHARTNLRPLRYRACAVVPRKKIVNRACAVLPMKK